MHKAKRIIMPMFFGCLMATMSHGGLLPNSTQSPTGRTLSPGEALSYTIQYYGIPGGTADIQINSGPSHLEDTLVFRADIKTNFAISAFWRIEDTFMTLVKKTGFRTIMTRLWEDENGKKQYREEKYRRDLIKVEETNRDKTNKFSVKTSGSTVDGLSALWLLRSKPLQVGDQEEFKIFANRKIFDAKAKVEKIDSVKVDGKRIEAIRVNPVLHHEGEPVKDTNVTVWYTNDQNRIPVKIESQNKYGKLKFVLNP